MLLAAHVLRRLVVAQSYEFRMAQMVHVGPVRILDLRDQKRLQPAAFGHLVGRETLTPPALVALGQVRKGEVLISMPRNRSNAFARRAGTNPLRTRAT
jgi:hypothetical protein